MKKLLLLPLSFAFVLALASCSKDHTCTCSYVDPVAGDTTFSTVYEDLKKGDAEDACSAQESLLKVFDAAATCGID